MNPFAIRNASNSWVVPVSLLTVVVGFLTSLAWITTQRQQDMMRSLPPDMRTRLSVGELDLSEEYAQVRDEVTKLREEKTKLENLLAQGKSSTTLLNESLQESKIFACLTEVKGPGVSITLHDSKKPIEDAMDPAGAIVHDTDVVKVVNELWASGAEAISVNNKRVGPTTSFRCVGPTILVDSVKIASPVVIRAIGDAETLYGGMNLPGGVLEELRSYDPKMVEVAIVKDMRLPAFAGSTTNKFAKVPEDSK